MGGNRRISVSHSESLIYWSGIVVAAAAVVVAAAVVIGGGGVCIVIGVFFVLFCFVFQ